MGNPLAHLVKKTVPGRIISASERSLEGQRIGRTMALKHQAAQPEQGRPVVATVINPTFKRR
jgi:hypothetical protein